MPRDRELIIEMNAEIAELTQTGKTKFHHRSGTHDDRLRALALAVYGSRHEAPSYHPFVAFGHIIKHPWEKPQIVYPLAGTPTPVKQQPICLTCGQPKTSNHEQYHKRAS